MTRRVVVDARPMQSASSADRGIGRYTVDCFRALERLDPGLVDAYVIDPELPLHRNLEPFGNAGKLLRSDRWEGPPPAVFHITSLWETVEQERLLPRWVEPGTTRLVMTVFDLIPMLFPETYLADPLVRVGYKVKLSTLRLADRIATISRTSAEDVVRLASLPAGIVVPVMGGVSEIFRPSSLDVPTLRARIAERFPEVGASPYVLAPLGIEPRKNVEPLIEAYSSLPDPLAERHPLVVQCAVAPEQAARLHEVHRAAGGRGRLVLTGFVAEEDLVLLYQGAELVVFPSRYEGLGLPVLEARSCGAAVICGDNSALREVQPDEAGRFDVGSVESIARALGDALEDPDLRARLRSRPVEHEFTWEHTASEVAGIYRELLATTRRPSVPRRARLGLATPVPPDTAGPAIYAGRLIPHLAELVDLTVLTNDQHELDGVRAQPLSDLHVAERIERPFDRVLYMLGNSERHISCEFFHRVVRPGAVLFHDARLVGLYREMARARPELLPDPAGLLPTLHGMYPGRYRPWVPEEEGDGLDQELVTRLGILMAEAVVRTAADAGEALLVHSEHAADLIEWDTGTRPQVAFPLPVPDLVGVERRPEGHLVVSFGVVSPAKCSETLLRALPEVPGARLVFAGPVDDAYRSHLAGLADRLGVADRFTMTGELSDDEYLAWMGRAAVAVQLRAYSNGESSASVTEAMAVGVPLVVSDIGSFRELPADAARRVPPTTSPEELADVLRCSLADADWRTSAAQRLASLAESRSFRIAAERLVDALFG